MRPPVLRLHSEELIIDSFAGGGGASLGIEWALGRSPDIAINHDPEAIAMHAANHPSSRHFPADVWKIDPVEVCGGRRVALAWFSPDCKHFSKAKGGKPVEKKIRGLAWVVVRWAKAVRPRVILLENVEEFADWGPLLDDGTPCPLRRGFTFRRWWKALENCGYKIEMRELRACDYGAPTSRKRLFVIARSDGQPIAWPEPTHGTGRTPFRTAAECITWSLPCPSIFLTAAEAKRLGLNVQRPLAEATLRRIARGVRRYVLETATPFVVPGPNSPTLIQTGYGERPGQAPRSLNLHEPLGTIVGCGVRHALVAAFLAKHYGGHEGPGSQMRLPVDTITARDHHALVTASLGAGARAAESRAFLVKYYGTDGDPQLGLPLHTITTKDRFGLVTVEGQDYAIADIGMRMLQARELFRAQGFPDSYRIEVEVNGKPLSKGAQVRMCGNSVSPVMSRALAAAQFTEQAEQEAVA